jgi:Lrp/AsnC family leucine-responsive transcriptional regulator
MSSQALDDTSRRLLLALSRAGRRPASALAKELGLSRQAVAERLRDLERRGVIRGYHVVVDPAALGLGVRAQIRLSLEGSVARRLQGEVLKRLAASPLVRSVYRVSGEDCFVVQVVCRRIEDVNVLLTTLLETGAVQSSRTAFVLETLLEKGGLGPVDDALLAEAEPEGAGPRRTKRSRR